MATPATPDLPFERHTLANGLRVVLHRDSALPLVTVNLWYHVGSKDERPGRTGFAHLFEHMLFQGSENVGTNDHFRYIQQVGGVANGSTWYDRTNYYETLPAHQLDLGLWLESDRMGYLLPAITEENLETQRFVVMNERRQRVDNQPYGGASERLHELLYPAEHPYHWPVIGYMEDIEAATLEDVRAFCRSYYTPNNAVLTLAGDFEPEEALARVEHYFGDIPSGPPVPPLAPIVAGLQPLADGGREAILDDVRLPRVYFGFRAPAYGRRLWYAADLLAGILSGGKSSVLYRDLVYERQIVQDIGAYVDPTEAVATFAVIATARPGVPIETVEAAVAEHLARAAGAPPHPDDLERACNKVLTEYYSGLQKLDNRADLFSQFTTLFDDPGGLAREADRYREVTGEDVAAYAAAFLAPERGVRVTVEPRSAG
ncbi:MAG TPA: pitrilysin family protein [Thermoanaerobaculia bacterium]|jgi:zinc protease